MTGRPTWATVCATGHRPQHLTPAEQSWAKSEATRIVTKLRDEYGMKRGVSGMALGWDMWWAAALVDAGVDLSAHVPFPQQPDPWWRTPEHQREWSRLTQLAADSTTYGDLANVVGDARKRRAAGLLHKRNDGMLDVSAAVVALWKRSKTNGGTASAVRKAERRGLPIIHLDPERQTVALRSPTLSAPAGVDSSPLLPERTPTHG